jgi:hypothetical protein
VQAKSNQLQQSVMLAQNISVCGNLFAKLFRTTRFQPRRKNSVKWRKYNCRESGAEAVVSAQWLVVSDESFADERLRQTPEIPFTNRSCPLATDH